MWLTSLEKIDIIHDMAFPVGAVDESGQRSTLERVFAHMKMILEGEKALHPTIKAEEEDRDCIILSANSVRYTQEFCSYRFRCGKSVEDTIEGLVKWVRRYHHGGSSRDLRRHARYTLEGSLIAPSTRQGS